LAKASFGQKRSVLPGPTRAKVLLKTCLEYAGVRVAQYPA